MSLNSPQTELTITISGNSSEVKSFAESLNNAWKRHQDIQKAKINNEFYTVRQVAKKTNQSEATITRLIREGVINAIKRNKKSWLISHDSLTQYLNP